jgi:thymidylate synthase (FAD)
MAILNHDFSNASFPKVELEFVTPNAERLMGYVARVSNPSNQDNPNVAGLLKYCIKHGHWSVFEHAHMTLRVTTTLDIATQILRHRSFTFQQLSRRYAGEAEAPVNIYMPHLRAPHPKNRQKSVDELPSDTQLWFQAKLDEHFRNAEGLYRAMLEHGVAKECARAVLPQATETSLYMTGNTRSWMHYICLRAANGTQEEHQVIALKAKAIFRDHFPSCAEALDSLSWNLMPTGDHS